MKWKIEYSRRAYKFIEKHKIHDEIKKVVVNFLRMIKGEPVKVDVKRLKGEWKDYLRIRKGKLRIILKVEWKRKTILVEAIDFRGNIY